MDGNFDWALAKCFIKKYVQRCVQMSIIHYVKCRATYPGLNLEAKRELKSTFNKYKMLIV